MPLIFQELQETLTTTFEKDGGEGGGGEGDQKWFLELPRATPGS